NNGRALVILFFTLLVAVFTATFFQLFSNSPGFFSGTACGFFLRFLALFSFLFATSLFSLALPAFVGLASKALFFGLFLGHLFGGLGYRDAFGFPFVVLLFLGLAFRRSTSQSRLLCSLTSLLFLLGLAPRGLFLRLAASFFFGLLTSFFFQPASFFFLRQTLLLFNRCPLHVGALLAHLHMDGLCLASCTGGLDGAGRAALEGDFLRVRRGTMRFAQVREQLLLLFIGDLFTGIGVRQSGFFHL